MKLLIAAAALCVVCGFAFAGSEALAQADLDAEKAGGAAVPSHHSPYFVVDPEPSSTMGVRARTVAVLELMETS